MSELLNIKDNLLENNNPSKATDMPGYTFTGDKTQEKELLKVMGFEEDLIDIIYKNMNPIDLQEALDYLNKNEKGQFTHSFLINEHNVCTICGKGRIAHESDTLFVDNNDDILDDVDENNDFIGDLLGMGFNSNRFRAFEDSYRKSIGKEKKKEDKKFNYDIECGICGEIIDSPFKVKIKCNHNFCKDCWIDYLTEKITNANVSKIFCMQHGCGTILESKFIKNILEGKKELIEKYDKFYQRKKMLEQSVSLSRLPDISKWYTKKVTNMSSLFNNCVKLTKLPDISVWDTSNVTDMSFMFNNCSKIAIFPDLSKWDTSNLIESSFIFNDCRADIRKFSAFNFNIIL